MPEDPTRLLVAGVGPLPPERPERLHAPGLRIWGIARELARAGHPVRLICSRFGEQSSTAYLYDIDPAPEPALSEARDLTVEDLNDWSRLLAEQARAFGATAAVGSTDVMNYALGEADLKIPIWMDYFGDPMAERQLLALRHGSDVGLDGQWGLVASALTRADRVSGCSTDQCAALLGQLGAVGRLGRHTAYESLVRLIPPWIEPIPIDIDCDPLVRGPLVPEDAFLIVQTGGFNTWLDVEILFAALERAMAADARIHFAATGGAIPGHHAGGFEWFQENIRNSPLADRFHLLGWVPLGRVPRVIREADLGLNVDFQCPEGRLGTRNRLMDWLLYGVPVVSTPGCELADELEEEGFLSTVPYGDPRAIAQAIERIAANPKTARAAAAEGAQYLRRRHAPDRCLASLIKWASSPKSASDLQVWNRGVEPPPDLVTQTREVVRWAQEASRRANRLAWLERRLARLEGSRWVRLALALRGRSDLEVEPPPEEL